MATNVHEVTKDYARRALADINYMGSTILNLQGGDNTVALLKTRVTTSMSTRHDNDIRRGEQINKAIDFVKNAGCLTDADMATVAAGGSVAARFALLQGIFTAIETLVAAGYSAMAGATP